MPRRASSTLPVPTKILILLASAVIGFIAAPVGMALPGAALAVVSVALALMGARLEEGFPTGVRGTWARARR